MDIKTSLSSTGATPRALPSRPPRSSSVESASRPAPASPPAYPGPSNALSLVQLANVVHTKSSPDLYTRHPPELWVNARTTSLHQAILDADVELVRDHLDAGASVHLTDGASMTPLTLACSLPAHPHPDLLDLLLQRGARPNDVDKEKWTALLYATHRGHTQAVLTLLQHGADVTAQTKTGSTALHLVDDVQTAQYLLLAGANPNVLNSFAQSPLLLALPRGNLALIRALLKNGADPDIKDNYMAGVLTHCIHGSDAPDIIRLLLLNGANPNVVDTYGYTPLHHAAAHDRCETAALLIEAGADVATATSWRGGAHARKVDGPHMKAFLDRQGWGAKYGGGMKPLHVAAFAGSVFTLLLLLEEGQAQVDQRSRRNMTALHFCSELKSYGDHVRIARVLVEHGADVNATAEGNMRPLHCAAEAGKTALVEYLVEQGADVGPVTKNGMTPAKFARASGYKALSFWLEERDSRSALRKMRDGMWH